MFSKVTEKNIQDLTVRELEELLERKKGNETIAELIRQRDHLRLELQRVEDQIELIERSGTPGGRAERSAAERQDASYRESYAPGKEPAADSPAGHSFLAGKRKNNLKDYIAQVLLQARGPLSASEIQRELPEVGYVSSSTNPRSF